MSNPSVCYLSKTKINGMYFAVEDNLGEAIHIHYADIRIDMTIREFLNFADCVGKAAKELFALNNLNMDFIDDESIKEEWMSEYRHITSMTRKRVTLSSLYMKESYIYQRSIKRIIPLGESGYIPFYMGVSLDREYYEEPGIFEPSRGDKARQIETRIKEKGFPYDNKRILVDQNGYILDGLKRASCLYYLYGGNYEIPVVQIHVKWGKSIVSRREEAENAIEYFEKNRMSGDSSNCPKDNQLSELIEYEDLIDKIRTSEIGYTMILEGDALEEGVHAFVLLKKETYDQMKDYLRNFFDVDESYFKRWYFAYAVRKPLVCHTDRGQVIFHEKFFVKSKFVKDVMLPLDKKIQTWLWKNREYDNESRVWRINDQCETLLKIIQYTLAGENYTDKLVDNINRNRQIFKTKTIRVILELVFFRYTDRLIENILEGKYKSAVDEYVTYADY